VKVPLVVSYRILLWNNLKFIGIIWNQKLSKDYHTMYVLTQDTHVSFHWGIETPNHGLWVVLIEITDKGWHQYLQQKVIIMIRYKELITNKEWIKVYIQLIIISHTTHQQCKLQCGHVNCEPSCSRHGWFASDILTFLWLRSWSPCFMSHSLSLVSQAVSRLTMNRVVTETSLILLWWH